MEKGNSGWEDIGLYPSRPSSVFGIMGRSDFRSNCDAMEGTSPTRAAPQVPSALTKLRGRVWDKLAAYHGQPRGGCNLMVHE